MQNWNQRLTLKRGLNLLSDEAGIIEYISKVPRLSADPSLISYGIEAADTTALGANTYSGRSGGAGDNWRQAMLKTLGEVVERYCPVFYDVDRFEKASYQDLNGQTVAPREKALFHPHQYRGEHFHYVPFERDTEVHWEHCIDMTEGGRTYYPAAYVYMPWRAQEPAIGYTTTTGLAAHTSTAEAVLGGLYEVIERDSFVITWLQKLDVPRIRLTPDLEDYIYDRFPDHYEFHLFDITLDLGVPTVWGLCFGETEYGEFMAVGASTRSTYEGALKKTVNEIGQAIPYFRHFLEEHDGEQSAAYEELTSFEDHSLYYINHPDEIDALRAWLQTGKTREVPFSDGETPRPHARAAVDRIVDRLAEKGYRTLVTDLTTEDVLQAGFKCVKVSVPSLIELAGSYRHYMLGGSRLYDVPEQVDGNAGPITGTADAFGALNAHPHPFP
jgi:ribosomal protein S12 methylthiotransferase accessory factor